MTETLQDSMVLLALMSGTSVDACDAILCEVGTVSYTHLTLPTIYSV